MLYLTTIATLWNRPCGLTTSGVRGSRDNLRITATRVLVAATVVVGFASSRADAHAVTHPTPRSSHQRLTRAAFLQNTASPFIATNSPNSGDVSAKFVSSVNGPAILVSTNEANLPVGTYSGILISPPKPYSGLQTVSFVYKGSIDDRRDGFQPEVVVQWGDSEHVISRSALTAAQAARSVNLGNDLHAVEFNASQFGMVPKSVVHNIVITDPYKSGPGTFLASDIRVNGFPVTKDLKDGTKFFDVESGSATGPLGDVHAGLTAGGGSTTLTLTNGTGNQVTAYITLGVATANYQTSPCVAGTCVQSVADLFAGAVPDTGNPLSGSISLGPNASVSYTGGQTVSGFNVAFSAPFVNCPSATQTNGMNVGETTLNVPLNQPNATYPYQDTVDISCVAGVNSDIAVAMINSSNQPDTNWTNGFSGPGGTTGPVTNIENKSVAAGNTGIPGVFPPGCDDCADRTTINPPPCFTSPQCNTLHICNVQRNQSAEGGTVTFTFNGPL